MTIFYIDPVNGNDASAGTTWATAWKTFVSGPTAARIAPDDEIRIAKSPDPTDVGTATWTNRKVGNSITFSSAPTKVIDTMDSGFVTMGAGSTVTNSQSTAYMMWGTTPGTGSTMQYVTSATTNGAYKNLGSVINYSGYQQVCFWFRTTVALDCTGAQNFNVRLCSDTAGVTVVDTLPIPKWNYAANTWYPIVVDKGSALGSNIQSISFTTTSATTQTFYLDELFASPAGGLTLWSLIEDNTETWYPIRTIRDADVWLFGNMVLSSATGGSSGAATYLDPSWVGTTATFTTRKRETMKAYAAAGPTGATWAVANEAGVWTSSVKQLNKYRFGFNTSSDTQDGDTYIDNISQVGNGLTSSFAAYRYENLVTVRFSSGINLSGSSTYEYNNIGAIGCSGSALSLGTPCTLATWPTASKIYNFLSITSNNSVSTVQFGTTSYICPGLVITTKGIVNNQGGLVINYLNNSTLTIPVLSITGTTSAAALGLTSTTNNTIIIPRAETPITTTTFPNAMQNTTGLLQVQGSSENKITIDELYGAGLYFTNSSDILKVLTFGGTALSLIYSATSQNSDNVVVYCPSNNSSATGAFKWAAAPGISTNGLNNSKLYIHDFNGPGTAAVIAYAGSNSFLGQFELQTGDVHTGGSKAWKYTAHGSPLQMQYSTHSLKLASVAAVANKLVTVTAWVKKTANYQGVGIRVPAIFLPGYTSDISTSFTGTVGAWQQLTITFTPTADCVFDVLSFIDYNSILSATDAVWDDLSVTQAA